eukprot:TRINITY_DN1091_c0_g2_i1.p1 TRINITY_DN1091_c0_g2~~TRINITY_DN1091_c0_g2_i1.p1  ORF type:complete len:423 (+),score=135.77 TRINITY_DN1091_c0_g2_i1:94-1362(+)
MQHHKVVIVASAVEEDFTPVRFALFSSEEQEPVGPYTVRKVAAKKNQSAALGHRVSQRVPKSHGSDRTIENALQQAIHAVHTKMQQQNIEEKPQIQVQREAQVFVPAAVMVEPAVQATLPAMIFTEVQPRIHSSASERPVPKIVAVVTEEQQCVSRDIPQQQHQVASLSAVDETVSEWDYDSPSFDDVPRSPIIHQSDDDGFDSPFITPRKDQPVMEMAPDQPVFALQPVAAPQPVVESVSEPQWNQEHFHQDAPVELHDAHMQLSSYWNAQPQEPIYFAPPMAPLFVQPQQQLFHRYEEPQHHISQALASWIDGFSDMQFQPQQAQRHFKPTPAVEENQVPCTYIDEATARKAEMEMQAILEEYPLPDDDSDEEEQVQRASAPRATTALPATGNSNGWGWSASQDDVQKLLALRGAGGFKL